MKYEEICERAMEIIASAGTSKSLLFEAIEFAKNGDIKKAKDLFLEAEKHLIKAHDYQTNLIILETSEEKSLELNLIMVHAQDHLTMASIIKDSAIYFMDLYEKLNKIGR
ncbi:PTS lactose/cellobiose transporter subunit IIA [Oceanivirga salmonicida]|uniref:PTS lactose/cellobiose transporter subunit IIA n=1 Tax=Oceanivirga salmonicida TaxID=1769291 RepID=UPI00082A15C5|nr:PTS lactose/cellobiose transporter subunit IIA [Oceanivirga salmonicida]